METSILLVFNFIMTGDGPIWRTHKRYTILFSKKRVYLQAEYEERLGIKNHDVKFNIVAHSMSGLITRYFLRYGNANLPNDGPLPKITWKGAKYVRQAVFLGTPNAGSALAIDNLVEGLKLPLLANYEPAILGTFPSIYELLPRPRHGLWREEGTEDKISFYQPAIWEKMQWGLANPKQDKILRQLMPAVKSPEERYKTALDHQRKCLKRTERFHAALDKPAIPPKGVRLHLMAGDAKSTAEVVEVNPETGKMKVVRYGQGDETVLRSSALMDERVGKEWSPRLISSINWTHATFFFQDHIGLTKDPVFTDNILYLLLEKPLQNQ
ncbi:MAG: hypothetical protein GKR87_12725 [Kiritimatiellae bacterium]|nr:hypothetical protein [Kiritimatiellia bacterium]